MPTDQNAYNSRLTDESLEKKFRDTFKSQGGAELVDDLYASGVIVPVIDFSAAAEGTELRQDLQLAWDFATTRVQIQTNTPTNIITNTGFWQVDLSYAGPVSLTGARSTAQVDIFDGITAKPVWSFTNQSTSGLAQESDGLLEGKFVVFLRSGDVLRGNCQSNSNSLDVWYRQIADVSGNLTNPLGFVSS